MRVTRLYCPQQLAQNEETALSPEHAHHLINVLRHSVGDQVIVFNETQGEFEASILSAKKSKATVRVGDLRRSFEPAKFAIHLFLGISRGDRMDYGIQKSVELGVSSITPLYTEFGEGKIKQEDRLEKKRQHWQRIAISASEQCGRLDVPNVGLPAEFLDCLDVDSSQSPLLVMDGNGTASISEVSLGNSVQLMVGPEGGFSAREIEMASENDGQIIKLGPRVLRTETAPVAALAILQHRFGDL